MDEEIEVVIYPLRIIGTVLIMYGVMPLLMYLSIGIVDLFHETESFTAEVTHHYEVQAEEGYISHMPVYAYEYNEMTYHITPVVQSGLWLTSNPVGSEGTLIIRDGDVSTTRVKAGPIVYGTILAYLTSSLLGVILIRLELKWAKE